MDADETQKLIVRQRFDRESSEWLALYYKSDFISLGFIQRQKLAMSMVPEEWNNKGHKALDIGCGAGLTSFALAQRGFETTGLDISAQMTAVATRALSQRTLPANCRFITADFDALDLPAGCFDVVVALGFLEYVPSNEVTIGKIHTVLKPGGVAVITVPNDRRITYILDPVRNVRVKRAAGRILKAVLPNSVFQRIRARFTPSAPAQPMPHRNGYTPLALDHMFGHAGFTKVSSLGQQYGPFTLFGREMFPDRVSKWIDNFLYMRSRCKVLGFLQTHGSTYIATYRKSGPPKLSQDIQPREP